MFFRTPHFFPGPDKLMNSAPQNPAFFSISYFVIPEAGIGRSPVLHQRKLRPSKGKVVTPDHTTTWCYRRGAGGSGCWLSKWKRAWGFLGQMGEQGAHARWSLPLFLLKTINGQARFPSNCTYFQDFLFGLFYFEHKSPNVSG